MKELIKKDITKNKHDQLLFNVFRKKSKLNLFRFLACIFLE